MVTFSELQTKRTILHDDIMSMEEELNNKYMKAKDLEDEVPDNELLKIFYIRDSKNVPTITTVIIRDIETNRILVGVAKCWEHDKCNKRVGTVTAIKKAYEYQDLTLKEFIATHQFLVPRKVFTHLIKGLIYFVDKNLDENFASTAVFSTWVSQLVYLYKAYDSLEDKLWYSKEETPESDYFNRMVIATFILSKAAEAVEYNKKDKYFECIVGNESLKSIL
jgi:hypothetical protein